MYSIGVTETYKVSDVFDNILVDLHRKENLKTVKTLQLINFTY